MTANPGNSWSSGKEQPASTAEISSSPLWHFHEYDLDHQTFTLMRIEESLYREASFLDARIREYDCPTVRYELKHMAGMFPRLGRDRGPMGFIFHVGHCGSTLLSRALAVSPKVLPLREPITLRTLSADHRDLDSPLSFIARPDWEWLLTTVLDSLARRFRPDQINIVKATSTGNNLIQPIMSEHEEHRAVMLFVPLDVYLATMLGKDKQGGDLWIQARTRMKDWTGIEGEPSFSLHELSAAQLAVLSWITSMAHLLAARKRFAERVLLLDFQRLISEPDSVLKEVASFFGLDQESNSIVKAFPEVSSTYSKRPDKRYTPETRERLLQLTRCEHGDEIRRGLEWAQALIDATPALQPLPGFVQ